MASIVQVGTRWRAQIRREGKSIAKTFRTKAQGGYVDSAVALRADLQTSREKPKITGRIAKSVLRRVSVWSLHSPMENHHDSTRNDFKCASGYRDGYINGLRDSFACHGDYPSCR